MIQKLKEENAAMVEEYGFCVMDGHKEKIGNFRIEPPGLFRGRGTHPKMGMLKRRVQPEDVIINCSRYVQPGYVPKVGMLKNLTVAYNRAHTQRWVC